MLPYSQTCYHPVIRRPEEDYMPDRNYPMVSEVLVSGTTYPILCDPRGNFHARIGSDNDRDWLRSSSFDGLVEALRRANARQRKTCAIPVARYDHHGLVKGTITGIHGGTGNPMVRWETGHSEQLTASEVRSLLDPELLGPDGERELLSLHDEVGKRRKRLDDVVRAAIHVNLSSKVEAALA